MRTETGHNQVGRQIEDHIADVKERQACRDLMVVQVQHTCEVVARVLVHRLRQTHIRTDGRAHKVNDPESRNDAPVKFTGECQLCI